jgi:hypothetical protein
MSPQSLSFYESGNGHISSCLKCERVDVLNKIGKEDAGLVAAYEEEIGEIRFKFPYAAELRRNYISGNIGATLSTPEGRGFATEVERMCGHALGRRTGRKKKGGASNGKLDLA